MMALADSTQLIVIDPGPAAALHRMLRPFMKGLSQKLWTGSSKLNDSRSAARYSYGPYASSTLHLMSILVTLAASHGCQQAWCHHRPSSWQGLSDRPTRMLTTGFSDGRVKLLNARLQLLKQCDERGYFQDIGIQQHRILYSGNSRAHLAPRHHCPRCSSNFP